jgi:hypothetical protein
LCRRCLRTPSDHGILSNSPKKERAIDTRDLLRDARCSALYIGRFYWSAVRLGPGAYVSERKRDNSKECPGKHCQKQPLPPLRLRLPRLRHGAARASGRSVA